MATGKPINLASLLAQETSALSRLARRAEGMTRLTETVRQSLPESLRAHLNSASVRDDTLIVIAESAVWAAKLRFYATEILSYMASDHTSAVRNVKVITRPPQ